MNRTASSLEVGDAFRLFGGSVLFADRIERVGGCVVVHYHTFDMSRDGSRTEAKATLNLDHKIREAPTKAITTRGKNLEVPVWANFLASNMSGDLRAFSHRPTVGDNGKWIVQEGTTQISTGYYWTTPWRASLIDLAAPEPAKTSNFSSNPW